MSRPEDIRIPADVDPDTWRSAAEAMSSVGWYGTSMIRGAYIAILAAKAEEREAIAQMADALADLFDGHAMRCAEEMDIVEARGAESAVRKFAAELRGEG